MAEGAVTTAGQDDDDRTGPWVATVGAAGMALSFGAVVALAGLPVFRVVAGVLGLLMVLLAVGLWRGWPGAIVLGIFVGGLAVGFGLPALLAAGDDVYEQVPSVWSAVSPALALALGAMVLVGGLASVVPAGRVGLVVAGVLLVVGVALLGVGAWRQLAPLQAPGTGSGVEADCGSALHPRSFVSGGSGRCWEVLGPARDDARSMLSWGAVVTLAGLGLLPTQFGRRAWPGVAVAVGLAAIGVACLTGSMPLQSNSCKPSNEAYTGPVCDGVRHGLTGVTIGYAVLGVILMVGGVVAAATSGRRLRSARSARRRPA